MICDQRCVAGHQLFDACSQDFVSQCPYPSSCKLVCQPFFTTKLFQVHNHFICDSHVNLLHSVHLDYLPFPTVAHSKLERERQKQSQNQLQSSGRLQWHCPLLLHASWSLSKAANQGLHQDSWMGSRHVDSFSNEVAICNMCRMKKLS